MDLIRLEPLSLDHADALAAGLDDTIWRLWPSRLKDHDDVVAHIEARHAEPDCEPFAIVRDGAVAGATSFYDIRPKHRHRSIGWTFILPEFRRTAVNTATKLEMLRRAFEDHACLRVQFDIDGRNDRSQAAVRRLGATHEGTLRQHKVLHDGYVRDTTVWSIVAAEWPGVKQRLEERLATHPPSG